MENNLWGLRNPSKIHLFPWFHLSLILSISSIQIMLKKFKKLLTDSFLPQDSCLPSLLLFNFFMTTSQKMSMILFL